MAGEEMMLTGNSRFMLDRRNVKHDNRPDLSDPNFLVIHTMAEYIDVDGKIMHAYDFLDERGLLPHFLITPSGVAIHMLSIDKVGAHAKGVNYESVGIEVLIPGILTYQKFTIATMEEYIGDAAWRTLVAATRDVLGMWPRLRIVGHRDIDPGRKIDPGNFVDLDRLKNEAA